MSRINRFVLAAGVAGLAALLLAGGAAGSARATAQNVVHRVSSGPDFGPNVIVFDSSMPTSQIQSTVDGIEAQQVSNQFGTQRYALLFKPGTYGSTADPLNFQVGYYTAVAGLGASPNDVVINGSVDVRNQCDVNGSCTALNNFWRSLSNLTINVTNPDFGCYTGEFWAVSQAAPMRRVHVNGQTTLMDYCTQPSYRERRLHRGLAVRRHGDQRLPAAVGGQEQLSSPAGRTASGTRSSQVSSARRPSASRLNRMSAVRTRRSRRAR